MLASYERGKLQSASPDRLIFNLFSLCQGLRQPVILSPPLRKIQEGRVVPPKDRRRNVGHHRGHGLLGAFRSALAENQADQALDAAWRGMLEGKPDEYLGGAPMDGFEGMLAMPEAGEVKVGWALARMADSFDNSEFREEQFPQLLDLVRARFKTSKWDIPLLAVSCEWKPWARKLVGESKYEPKIKRKRVAEIKVIRDPQTTIVVPESTSEASVEAIRQTAVDLQATSLPDSVWETEIRRAMAAGVGK